MKYTTAVALLPLAASAANVDKRQEGNEKFMLKDFAAKCYAEEGDYCVYEINISSSTEPEFEQGCDVTETSGDGSLPEVEEKQCGTFKISVTKSDDGGLILGAELRSERLIGEHEISKDDLETNEEDGRELQSYTGDKDFSIDASSGSGSGGSPTSTGSEPSGTASETGTASEPSGTETDGADSDNSEGDEDDGAARVGAFTGILMAVGVMAYML